VPALDLQLLEDLLGARRLGELGGARDEARQGHGTGDLHLGRGVAAREQEGPALTRLQTATRHLGQRAAVAQEQRGQDAVGQAHVGIEGADDARDQALARGGDLRQGQRRFLRFVGRELAQQPIEGDHRLWQRALRQCVARLRAHVLVRVVPGHALQRVRALLRRDLGQCQVAEPVGEQPPHLRIGIVEQRQHAPAEGRIRLLEQELRARAPRDEVDLLEVLEHA